MNYKKLFLTACLLVACSALSALEFKQQDREVVVTTKRLEATVKDGRIIHLKSRNNGRVFADKAFAEPSQTAGVGNMIGKLPELTRLHFPWGEPSVNKPIELKETDLYRHPTAKSELTVKKDGKGVVVTWKGLSDGKVEFPNDTLSIRFGEDDRGALTFLASGTTEVGGIFGIQVPVENITQESTFVLATFGGLDYPGKGRRGLMPFQSTTLFYEAPIMICMSGSDTFSMWSEDETFNAFYAYFTREHKSCSIALEFQTLIPFEQWKKAESKLLKLDVFEDSDWIEGARPYSDWYQKTFAKEIAIRDSNSWANKIAAIAEVSAPSEKALAEAARMIPAENVLLHVWQARKEGFTTNLPDYTPKKSYPGSVELMHKHGFKVMCYVCALCATYQSPAWKRDNLDNFFLPRYSTIRRYKTGGKSFDENLVGNTVNKSDKNPFEGMKPGKLYYGDPLSKGWRDYYTQLIKEFNDLTKTDANYQDTLGCTDDVGNGIIGGLSGAQGNAQLARDLQKKPGVPMSSEFGGAPIAFAVKWPLNYAQVWGGKKFRQERIHRHRPLTPFLFGKGYRTWVPTVAAPTDFEKNLVVATSDALSGLGMFYFADELQNNFGFAGHFVLRSQLFANKLLQPYYPQKRYPKNIRAMYQAKDGGIYQYYDDGHLQMMLDPNGKPVYGRLDQASELKHPTLTLPGWPIRDKDGIYSLNPQSPYALFPKDGAKMTKVCIMPLGKNEVLRFYYEADEFIYLEIGGEKGKNTTVTLEIPANIKEVICNDTWMPAKSKMELSGTLPLRVVLATGKTTTPDAIRKIANGSGLQDGSPEKLPTNTRNVAGKKVYHVNYYNAKSLDYVMNVKGANDALSMLLMNEQKQYGNGSTVEFLINGKQVAFFDCKPSKGKGKKKEKATFDTQLRKWTIPVGQFAGKNILVSVRVSNKDSNNADMQFISIPEVVQDSAQKFKTDIVDKSNVSVSAPAPKVERISGKPFAEVVPTWNSKQITVTEGEINYKPTTAHGLIFASSSGTIEVGKRYFLGCEVRKDGGDKRDTFYLGVAQYDDKGKEIQGLHINVVPNTQTMLSHPAKAGSNKIMVMDASNWTAGCQVALGTSVPNRNMVGTVIDVKKNGGDWTVFLKSPLKVNIESDSPVQLHRATGTHLYVSVYRPTDKFAPIGKEIKWWLGAVKYKVLMLSKQPVAVKNLKLELYDTVENVVVPTWKSKQITENNGELSYKPTTSHGVLYASNANEISADKRYFLRCDVRKDGGDKKDNFFLGVVQYDAKGKEINGLHINVVPDTATKLAQAAKAGAKELTVKDASKWKTGCQVALGTTIPNRNMVGRIASINKNDNDWTVTLTSPLKKDIAADTEVQLHRATGTHLYSGVVRPTDAFTTISKEIKWWPGAVKYKVLILSKQPVTLKNLRVELYDAVKK